MYMTNITMKIQINNLLTVPSTINDQVNTLTENLVLKVKIGLFKFCLACTVCK